MGTEASFEGPAHVNDSVGELGSALFAKPSPETFAVLFRASLDDVEHLRATDQGPVAVTLTDCDLVHAHHRNPVQRPIGLKIFEDQLIDRLHRAPMQRVEDRYSLYGRHLAHLRYEGRQGPGNPCALGYERERLQYKPGVRAIDAVAPKPEEGKILPPRDVLHPDPSAGVCPLVLAPAPTTFEATTQPLRSQHNSLAPTARLYLQLYDAMALNSRQPSEIMELHRVASSPLSV